MKIIYKNPNWKIFHEWDKIVISWGQDEVYLLDEIKSESFESFMNFIGQESIVWGDFEVLFPWLWDKLLNAWVFYEDDKKEKREPIQVWIVWCGTKDVDLSTKLTEELKAGWMKYIETCPDINIYIRTNALLQDCIDVSYKENADIPHIFVDLANSHTISIWPYVKNGYTSCIGCLIWKIQYHWGDIQIPTKTGVLTHTNLISNLIVKFLSEFSAYGSCPMLVNNIVSWNVDTMIIKHESIYRLPWCPFCWYDSNKNANNKYGKWSFEIPWNF